MGKELVKNMSNAMYADAIKSELFKISETDDVRTSLCYEVETNTFWKYKDGVWSVVKRDDILLIIRKWLMKNAGNKSLTMGMYNDIADQLAMTVDRHDVLDDGWVAFEDGSWNPDTDEFADHAPFRFATIKVKALYKNLPRPEDYPLFSKFIADICVDEDGKPLPAMVLQLQEVAGYMLLASSDRAMSFFFSGRGRNGKSVFAHLIQHMIGKERVSNMGLDDLTGDKFATADLIGKRLNVSDETNTHKDAASSMFKKLVSGDRLRVQRKFEQGGSLTPRAKYLLILNGVPTFDGFDYALRERILAIPFFRSFSEDERDYTLEKRIKATEMPGIVAWAIEGLRRLQKNKLRFTKTVQSETLLNEFEDASSSLSEFYNEGWEASGVPFPSNTFYEEYEIWCKKSGRKVMSKNRVSRLMADKVGRGRSVRIGQTVTSGIMVKRKDTQEEKQTLDF